MKWATSLNILVELKLNFDSKIVVKLLVNDYFTEMVN